MAHPTRNGELQHPRTARAEKRSPPRDPDRPESETLVGIASGILVAIASYTRLRQSRVLDQETRMRVYEAICAEPGIRVGTIAACLGLGHNTVLHHVRILR